MDRFEENRRKPAPALSKGKASFALLLALCLTALLLAGCGVRVNVNRGDLSVEELLVNQDLVSEPAAYREDGKYSFSFYYAKGGFLKMDLSQAYIAYYADTVLDEIEGITGEDWEEIPPLPADAQEIFDDTIGSGQLEKIGVIKIETLNDNTLEVSFTDKSDPMPGREYFFIIPNMGLAGSVITN